MQHNYLQSAKFAAFLAGAAATALAGLLLARQPAALALDPQTTASPNVIAFPFQIGPGAEGIALIDTQTQNIAIYQYQFNARQPVHQRFVLLAARSYRYDRQLEQFNTAPPLDEVKAWAARAAQLKATGAGPTTNQPNLPTTPAPEVPSDQAASPTP